MPKVLIVLDGIFRFGEPSASHDFTFTTLVDALTAAGMDVTKAHRETDRTTASNTDPGADGTADIHSFHFDTSVDLRDYDVIWLIGYSGRNRPTTTVPDSGLHRLPDTEIAAIARFMEAGGGVFATGDHDSIGADMSGHIPRIRAMRTWYGADDHDSPMVASFPRNFPAVTTGRADTVQKNPLGNYDVTGDGVDDPVIWFENQSDSIPQPITPTTSPAHPILRQNDRDIIVYPDHMHEGNTLGEVPGYDYTQTPTYDGQAFVEFPAVAGHRETPAVIATGQVLAHWSRYASTNTDVDPAIATPKSVNSLSVYDGRIAGRGRIVTGSTFHHYIDINLTGDSTIVTAQQQARTGPDAVKGQGFNHPGAEATFADIKSVYVNITNWLARPRPALQLILERSTFSQAEATATPSFDGAILVIVDGLKPSQFPGGRITTLSPSAAQLATWAPTITPQDPTGLTITPTSVASDDPALPDRLQRFTFTYRVTLTGAAFGFAANFHTIRVDAALSTPAVAAPLTDSAWIELVKSANPFMLDLDGGNTTTWLSSDVRVFPVVSGTSKFAVPLPSNASRADALTFLHNLLASMSPPEFDSLSIDEAASALSPFPTTTGSNKNVYNFAVARVRLPSAGASANDVRVFFRIFTSQTTAALTYHDPGNGPIEGYRRTPDPNPIALPGINPAGTEWLSFPMFSTTRAGSPETQTDPDNVKPMSPGTSVFFGALIDNNLNDPYLPPSPIGGNATGLPSLVMGEHQCLVAQIEFAGTPIPDGAGPSTSDKLSQRNIAMSAIANPGLDASRMALHTFEIEATPHAIADGLPPDELMLDWRRGAPDGTEVRIFIPSWDAEAVVALADRFYPRHEVRALDAHTIAVPGGGVRYVPVPQSQLRRPGVIIADFPLGVKYGQRYDVAVSQITNRHRSAQLDPPRAEAISLDDAKKLIKRQTQGQTSGRRAERGVFDLGDNRVLLTDLSVLDGAGDHAIIIEHPDPTKVDEAQRDSGSWREKIGTFQLGVPVSVKTDMLAHHLRLLSVLRWRAEWLQPTSHWYPAFTRYVELITEKVRALGGDPYAVSPTPDGAIPLPHDTVGRGVDGGAKTTSEDPFVDPQDDDLAGDTVAHTPSDETGRMLSGKISGLQFDHFGDFEGFTLEVYDGSHLRFFSREPAVLDLARTAWIERYVVTVITVSASRRVHHLLLRGHAD